MSCSSGGLSFRLSLCNSATPSVEISVKFSAGRILISKEKPNFVKSGQKLSRILHEDQTSIYNFRWRHIATKVLLCNMLYCYIVNSTCSSTVHTKNCFHFIATMSTRTRHNKTLYVHCLSCCQGLCGGWEKRAVRPTHIAESKGRNLDVKMKVLNETRQAM